MYYEASYSIMPWREKKVEKHQKGPNPSQQGHDDFNEEES